MAEAQRYPWQDLERDDLLGLVAGQMPPSDRWGYYGVDVGISGSGQHFWFGSLAELCAFLVEGEPLISEAEGTELRAASAAVRPIAERIESGASRVKMRSTNSTGSQYISSIEWIGTFDELLSGESVYARLARADFRRLESADEAGALPRSG